MFSISRCLLYQLWGFLKQKFIKLVAVIVYARLERKVSSLQKLNQFNITEVSVLCTETVNSFFHFYGCGYPYNCIYDILLVAGIPDVVDGLVAVYLRYFN
jgi:hypothetical protein